MTDEQTFADYRNRLNIKDVLEDAGYTFYKRDGLRYPAYVGLDNNGQRIRGDKFMAIDDYHRMKLFSHIFKEVDMKTIPGEGKNIGAQIGGALLAGLAVMSELGRDRPAPAVFVEHHHDHAHGPHVYFKGSVDSPQDLASRAFDAGLNAGEHGVGLGHGR